MVTHDESLVVKLVQIGIDLFGLLKSGACWRSDGGHGSGRKWPILFAGALLNDEEMLSIGKTHEFATDPQVGKVRTFGEDCSTYVAADGTYRWGGRHCYKPTDLQEPYEKCCTINTWLGAALACRLMRLEDRWNHRPFFEVVDAHVARTDLKDWERSWSPWVWTMWQKYRGTV
jgi:hypothetical protein